MGHSTNAHVPATSRLSSWQAVRRHVMDTYPSVRPFSADIVGVRPPGRRPGGRVGIRRLEPAAEQHDWMEIVATVCSIEHADFASALIINAQLKTGALCAYHGWLSLRLAVPIDDLEPARVDDLLETIAVTAARVASRVREPPAASVSLTHL